MMLNKIFFIGVAALCFACKKQTVYNGQPVTIAVFNGLNDGLLVYGNYSGSQPETFRFSQQIYNGGALKINFEEQLIRAMYFVSPDTLETDKPVFDKELAVEPGRSYSLYLTGDKTATDHLFFENNFKAYEGSDSVTFLQIVNISNDQPISVNIKGEGKGSLISSLAYKEASPFMQLSADHHHPVYEFEFRDATTGELLFTQLVEEITGSSNDLNRYLYKNWTLVFTGKRGALDINAIAVRKTFYQKP